MTLLPDKYSSLLDVESNPLAVEFAKAEHLRNIANEIARNTETLLLQCSILLAIYISEGKSSTAASTEMLKRLAGLSDIPTVAKL